jgi:hypothetical protein
MHGQPDSHISGQGGPEILGGKFCNYLCINSFFITGSASTRITGQSVDEQLRNPLPTNSGK